MTTPPSGNLPLIACAGVAILLLCAGLAKMAASEVSSLYTKEFCSAVGAQIAHAHAMLPDTKHSNAMLKCKINLYTDILSTYNEIAPF
jgi:hypothetical protein